MAGPSLLAQIQPGADDNYSANRYTIGIEHKAATTMTAAEFDAIGTLHAFPAFNDATALTKAKELANGKVVYFKTEAGKHGYFKVVDLYTKGDKAKFDFIVEQ